jgi:D-3-phosphoglycerate dehydrogenase
MHILIADAFEAAGVAGLERLGATVTLEPDLSPDTLPEALRRTGARVLVVRSTKVPAAVLDSAPGLSAVIRAGAGYDNIDFEHAAELGIAVCNTPGMNAVAVAELTMGHLINLDRRLPDQNVALKGGEWKKKEYGKARGLKGLSLLVIGTGAIGTEVIKRAQAFGMEIWAQSRSLRDDTARALGIRPIAYTREALYEALTHMDAVTVHLASTPDTRALCDARFFDAMKPGAYFINTSRGEVVDEAALLSAIEIKGVRAALDVYLGQPKEATAAWTSPTAQHPGVYASHHCGASTDQAQFAVAEEVVNIVAGFERSGEWMHQVNTASMARR